jgi:hypothetical protein
MKIFVKNKNMIIEISVIYVQSDDLFIRTTTGIHYKISLTGINNLSFPNASKKDIPHLLYMYDKLIIESGTIWIIDKDDFNLWIPLL